ncbi:MAG: hypothetical protein QXR80_06875, partial [Desulfurococcaceae archaeon]
MSAQLADLLAQLKLAASQGAATLPPGSLRSLARSYSAAREELRGLDPGYAEQVERFIAANALNLALTGGLDPGELAELLPWAPRELAQLASALRAGDHQAALAALEAGTLAGLLPTDWLATLEADLRDFLNLRRELESVTGAPSEVIAKLGELERKYSRLLERNPQIREQIERAREALRLLTVEEGALNLARERVPALLREYAEELLRRQTEAVDLAKRALRGDREALRLLEERYGAAFEALGERMTASQLLEAARRVKEEAAALSELLSLIDALDRGEPAAVRAFAWRAGAAEKPQLTAGQERALQLVSPQLARELAAAGLARAWGRDPGLAGLAAKLGLLDEGELRLVADYTGVFLDAAGALQQLILDHDSLAREAAGLAQALEKGDRGALGRLPSLTQRASALLQRAEEVRGKVELAQRPLTWSGPKPGETLASVLRWMGEAVGAVEESLRRLLQQLKALEERAALASAIEAGDAAALSRLASTAADPGVREAARVAAATQGSLQTVNGLIARANELVAKALGTGGELGYFQKWGLYAVVPGEGRSVKEMLSDAIASLQAAAAELERLASEWEGLARRHAGLINAEAIAAALRSQAGSLRSHARRLAERLAEADARLRQFEELARAGELAGRAAELLREAAARLEAGDAAGLAATLDRLASVKRGLEAYRGRIQGVDAILAALERAEGPLRAALDALRRGVQLPASISPGDLTSIAREVGLLVRELQATGASEPMNRLVEWWRGVVNSFIQTLSGIPQALAQALQQFLSGLPLARAEPAAVLAEAEKLLQTGTNPDEMLRAA